MVSIIKRHFEYTLCFVRIVFNALFFTVDDCSVKSGVVLRMVNVCIFLLINVYFIEVVVISKAVSIQKLDVN